VIPLVLVPAHDEASTVGAIVRRARAHARVLVVDDGSTDATASMAADAGAEVLRHGRRLGKAQAIRTGIAAARARGATHVVTLDADGQHDPDDVPALLAAAGPRTIVVGARPLDDGALSPGRAEAIVVAGFFVNWASGLRLADTQSGFRIYPVALFDEVRGRCGGFVLETEVLVAAATRGWTVREVRVRALPRAAARSRFRPIADGVAIGAYLGGRALARAAGEATAAAAGVIAIVDRGRRRARHAAILDGAAPYAGTVAWSLAMGIVAARRAAARLAQWWHNPRRRRATAAATAAAGLTVVLPLLAAAAICGRRVPGARALVAALYAQERLEADGAARAPVPADTLWTRS
jgi:hypothetical protein